MTKKWVYLSRSAKHDLTEALGYEPEMAETKEILGGKGAGLAMMTAAAIPVPPAFTITTEACVEYMKTGDFPQGMWEQTLEALRAIERDTGKKFGDPANPLLVSVRSGARESMPGMMDTVLNVGLNPDTLQGMAQLTGNERSAWDAYRRLVQMFGNIVKEIERRETRLPKIYPANLYRRIRDLSRKRLVSDCCPPRGSAVDSRRRYFRLTELGRMVLEEEAARIDGLAREVERMGVSAPAWGK